MDFSMFTPILEKLPLTGAVLTAAGLLIVGLIVLFVQLHITANPTYQTPRELRRNSRLDRLGTQLGTVKEPLLKAMLEEECLAVIFSEHTGLHVHHQTRADLITLHQSAGGRFGWRGIRRALPHLRQDRQGHLRPGISFWDWTVFILFGLGGTLLLVIGILWLVFFGSPYFTQYPTLDGFLVAVLPTGATILAGILSINVTAPILWAMQLQVYIKPPPVPITQPDPEAGQTPTAQSISAATAQPVTPRPETGTS